MVNERFERAHARAAKKRPNRRVQRARRAAACRRAVAGGSKGEGALTWAGERAQGQDQTRRQMWLRRLRLRRGGIEARRARRGG